jgi:plastocyanin
MQELCRRITGSAIVILFILLYMAAGCIFPQPSSAPAATVSPRLSPADENYITIENLTFNPPVLTIHAGSSATWINREPVTHSVVSDTGNPELFATAPLAYGQEQSIVFSKPGTYTYHCEIHPSMNGTVIVQP